MGGPALWALCSALLLISIPSLPFPSLSLHPHQQRQEGKELFQVTTCAGHFQQVRQSFLLLSHSFFQWQQPSSPWLSQTTSPAQRESYNKKNTHLGSPESPFQTSAPWAKDQEHTLSRSQFGSDQSMQRGGCFLKELEQVPAEVLLSNLLRQKA